MKDCEIAEERMQDCDRDAKEKLGLDDADLADLHFRLGLNHYLQHLARCGECRLNHRE